MTKKELQEMITTAVRKVVREEVKPLIETTIKKEFYKILNEAETAKPKRSIMVEEEGSNETSLMGLITNNEEDEARAAVNEKIFKGKSPFADVLNQTANDVMNRSGVYANPLKQAGAGDQIKVNLGESTIPQSEMVAGQGVTTTPATTQMSREDMAAKMGYGEIPKIGKVDNMPGIETKPKSAALQKIMAKEVTTPSAPLNQVELPTTNADGKPINYANVPQNIVKNMMKNYSGLMKKVDKEAKQSRPV